MLKRILSRFTHTVHELPVLVLMPHSRCNCRCVMCDIWKANHDKKEITEAELSRHLDAFRQLGVRHVALSGGEALMHPNLWKLCALLKTQSIYISLLTSGVSLQQHAEGVVAHTDEVIVSLDGPHQLHNQIRNVPQAFEKLQQGIEAVRALKPGFRITGRCVLQKLNFMYLHDIITTAQRLKLDQISFLAADVSSTAFNRAQPWPSDRVADIALTAPEVEALENVVQASFEQFGALYKNKFIAEGPRQMLNLVGYYWAMLVNGPFPEKKCNAPWVSAVVEANGDVRPCFFHAPYGNLTDHSLDALINSPRAVRFRKRLDIRHDPVCTRCVCSLYRK